jgi:hypothetical protein
MNSESVVPFARVSFSFPISHTWTKENRCCAERNQISGSSFASFSHISFSLLPLFSARANSPPFIGDENVASANCSLLTSAYFLLHSHDISLSLSLSLFSLANCKVQLEIASYNCIEREASLALDVFVLA